MARPRKKRRANVAWLPWTPDHERLFGLVPEDWSPPSRVRLYGGKRGITVLGRFQTPSGPQTARVRLEQDRHSKSWSIVERSISIHLVVRG
ncbi:MAG: hypothetical protein ACK4RV_11685 [Caulobacter sp.]